MSISNKINFSFMGIARKLIPETSNKLEAKFTDISGRVGSAVGKVLFKAFVEKVTKNPNEAWKTRTEVNTFYENIYRASGENAFSKGVTEAFRDETSVFFAEAKGNKKSQLDPTLAVELLTISIRSLDKQIGNSPTTLDRFAQCRKMEILQQMLADHKAMGVPPKEVVPIAGKGIDLQIRAIVDSIVKK